MNFPLQLVTKIQPNTFHMTLQNLEMRSIFGVSVPTPITTKMLQQQNPRQLCRVLIDTIIKHLGPLTGGLLTIDL